MRPGGDAFLLAAMEVTDRMSPGHVSLPDGMGLDDAGPDGATVRVGASPNELTALEDRDPFAGTPWHEFAPARVVALPA